MTEVRIAGLDVEQLTDLLGEAQAELASRERQNRRDLRAELERRVAAEGYKMADIFPELGGVLFDRRATKAAREVPGPTEPRADLERGRAHAEVGTGDPRRARDRHRRLQVDPDVSDPLRGVSPALGDGRAV